MNRMRRNAVPVFRALEHALDHHLIFDNSASFQTPHYIAHLTLQEKGQMTRSGALAKACQKLLHAHNTHDVTNMIRAMVRCKQFDAELESIIAPLSLESFLRKNEYMFVGANQKTFFNWRDPSSIECNTENGTAQIDFHLFCQDHGLDLSCWQWNPKIGLPELYLEQHFQEDVLTSFIKQHPNVNGAMVLDLLVAICMRGRREDDRNLEQYLRASLDDASYLQKLFEPYVNLIYSPSVTNLPSHHDVIDKALEHFHAPAQELDLSSLNLDQEFRQFFLTSAELLYKLEVAGAKTIQFEDCNIWCRSASGHPDAAHDPHLMSVLLRDYPELVDTCITSELPEAATRIDRIHSAKLALEASMRVPPNLIIVSAAKTPVPEPTEERVFS